MLFESFLKDSELKCVLLLLGVVAFVMKLLIESLDFTETNIFS